MVWLWLLKYCLKSLIRSTVLWNNSWLAQRFIKMVSAPNISGTSVRIVVPPREISKSEKRPTSGLAVMPDRPSLPPHFMPTTSFSTLTGSLSKPAA